MSVPLKGLGKKPQFTSRIARYNFFRLNLWGFRVQSFSCNIGDMRLNLRMLFVLVRGPVLALLVAACAGCSLLKKKQEPELLGFSAARSSPLTAEETKEVASQVGGNWLYGQGMGEAAVNVGAIVMFPPYAAVVAGNAALSLSGYEPIGVSTALSEEEGNAWSDAFDLITSGPGRLAAALAGKEYRTKEVARAKLLPILESREAAPRSSPRAPAQDCTDEHCAQFAPQSVESSGK
jgi:hypothetical protein